MRLSADSTRLTNLPLPQAGGSDGHAFGVRKHQPGEESCGDEVVAVHLSGQGGIPGLLRRGQQ
jgi:hypothetical protein